MPDEFGPHLLGRKPSPPDLRDYRLANFYGIGTVGVAPTAAELAAYATTQLQQTTITYKEWASRHYTDVTVTHWWKAFNALAQIVQTPSPPTADREWSSQFQLDQKDTGHCVGFGWAGWGDAEPVIDQYKDPDGHAIYYECKVIEGDPLGEDGAYPRDGAKAMKARGRLSTYAAAATVSDAIAWLRAKGPIVIGTDWTADMFTPDANGFIKPTGSYEGGHCYLLYGIKGTTLTFKNSWGAGWGDNGSFHMTTSDFTTLMQSYGEAWSSVELPLL